MAKSWSFNAKRVGRYSVEPEIIFSDLTPDMLIDSHKFSVEIYRISIHPGWVLSVKNRFGTLTISDDPPYLADRLARRDVEKLSETDGICAFYSARERRNTSALSTWPIRPLMPEVSTLLPPELRQAYFAQPRIFQLGCNTTVVTKLKCRFVSHLEMSHGAWSDKPAPARSLAQGA